MWPAQHWAAGWGLREEQPSLAGLVASLLLFPTAIRPYVCIKDYLKQQFSCETPGSESKDTVCRSVAAAVGVPLSAAQLAAAATADGSPAEREGAELGLLKSSHRQRLCAALESSGGKARAVAAKDLGAAVTQPVRARWHLASPASCAWARDPRACGTA